MGYKMVQVLQQYVIPFRMYSLLYVLYNIPVKKHGPQFSSFVIESKFSPKALESRVNGLCHLVNIKEYAFLYNYTEEREKPWDSGTC
jgi:hypothetical protein